MSTDVRRMATSSKLTPKQGAFCLVYLETGNATEAYRRVYDARSMKPATVNRNAKAMLDNNKIATRLAELGERAMERHDVTMDTITAQLLADRALAHREGQAGAAVSASMGLAKLHGLLMERSENINRNYVVALPEKAGSVEEWQRDYPPPTIVQ